MLLGGKTRAELSVPSPKQERAGASRETPPRGHVVQLPQPAEAEELIPAS